MYRRNTLSDLCESENVEKVCFYSHILVFTLIFNIFLSLYPRVYLYMSYKLLDA